MGGSNRIGVRRLGCDVSAATATLDQQRQEEDDVRSEHDEEDVAEAFAAMVLNLNSANGSPRHLERIKFFHSFTTPSQYGDRATVEPHRTSNPLSSSVR